MQLRNSAQGYGAVSMALHWLTVTLVATAWLLGTFGDDLPHALRSAGLFAHVSFGLAILIVVTVRIAWHVVDPPPPLANTRLGILLNVAAKLTHVALDGLLIAVPLIGILLQFARGDALPIFGILDVASPWVRDRAFARSTKAIHETAANTLMIVAALHAAAAMAHHWILRDRTLSRMLPGFGR